MHLLICGQTGSGKTNFALLRLLEAVVKGDRFVTAVFPHRKAGVDFIAELYARFGEAIFRRLIVDDLEDLDRVVMRQFIQRSDATGFFVRAKENDLYCSAVQDMAFRRRSDIKDLSDHPVLEKYTRIPVQVFQNTDCWLPEYLIQYVLQPRHPAFEFILSHLPHPELRMEMTQISVMSERDRMSLLEPPGRALYSMFASAPVMARTTKRPKVDWEHFLNSAGIHVVLGGNLSDDGLRVFVGCDFQMKYRLVRKGLKVPGMIFCDEINNYGLWGVPEARALSTIRGLGKGAEMVGATQGMNFPTPAITSQVITNTAHAWLANGDPEAIDIAAKDLRGGMDEYRIHHNRIVTRNMGLVPTVRKTTSVTSGEKGKSETESVMEQLMPDYRNVEDPVYQSGAEQMFWRAAALAELKVGQCWVREPDRSPYLLNVPLLRDSWAFPGLKELKFQQCLERMKSSPIYEEPELLKIELPTTSSERNGKKKPSQSLPPDRRRHGKRS
jgi:hypothetical protein